MDKIAIIGIGNPFRGDDGIGWAVIDALEGKVEGHVSLWKSRGDMGELIEYFGNFPTIYVVDACLGDLPAGRWQRLDAFQDPLNFENPQTSTHGFSISQAISMGRALNQLPEKLILYAINGACYHIGEKISGDVAETIPQIVQSILNEEDIFPCTKKV